ncbi:MAG: hypothetical protein SAL07_01875 [Oscillatoria sp. PMC 1051.18]|uniref:hypothetical protein n=1 Tax=Oscillatoria salina TaxID=331517 RepID=UPI0013B9F921|nr:hypothetical protein [Oscillatoria salina]MBZ8179918.1 hypothetical protein [Oscillatoria salina IIICB1]MEC4892006.1 hypothetical protein [Oscillatoria sp. PMC 1050.18]MEC5028633.1 hypothetical protein [Oscillatoria sp. PMC 1051.18]NET87465.1 hypothetical protein [Kamptonema sp. SIO1D9]
MSRSPNSGTTILLYILGIGLVITAILVVLKGTGILEWIPPYAIWATALFSIGAGILYGINSYRR